MPRSGNGIYVLPPGQPVVTGATINSTTFNTLTTDLATALTTSVASDGQTAMSANLPMGGNKLTGVGVGVNTDDAATFGQLTSLQLGNLLPLADYPSLRAYVGAKTSVYITGYLVSATPSGIVGMFVPDPSDTISADNGGTIIVATNGIRWKRQFDGPVNGKWFGAVGDNLTENFPSVLAAWNYCRPLGLNLYYPAGTYIVSGERSFPFRQGSGIITSLLDCNNMTIFGDGPATILKTTSVGGADVLQLNGLKNFHARQLQIQSVVTGTASGSNGISITGGFDNLTFDNIYAKNLGYVDKLTFVDGGKAFTIQPQSAANPVFMGSIKATNIFADGCVYGFGYEPDNVAALAQPVSIDIDIVASNCRQAVVFSAGAASAALPAYATNGVRVKAQSINCMQDVFIGRCFGISVDCEVIQTKTTAQLVLSYKGTQWAAGDSSSTSVIGLICLNGYNSSIKVYGNKTARYTAAQIGAVADPTSGYNASTNFCDIYLDLTGVSASSDIVGTDAGGNNLKNSRLYCTTSTTLSIPAIFYAPASNNTLTLGPNTLFQNVSMNGALSWTESDGKTSYHQTYLNSGNLTTQQTAASSVAALVQQWSNHAGAPKICNQKRWWNID